MTSNGFLQDATHYWNIAVDTCVWYHSLSDANSEDQSVLGRGQRRCWPAVSSVDASLIAVFAVALFQKVFQALELQRFTFTYLDNRQPSLITHKLG